ncbi:hypothetical protein ACIRP3_17805 [Streptomyces sp. NPDC101209]
MDPTAPDTRFETRAGQVSGSREVAEGTRAWAVFATLHVDGPTRD